MRTVSSRTVEEGHGGGSGDLQGREGGKFVGGFGGGGGLRTFNKGPGGGGGYTGGSGGGGLFNKGTNQQNECY